MVDEILDCLERAAKGDKIAFKRFAESIGKRVFFIAQSITHDPSYNEDVLNIVLLKTWQNIEKIVNLKKPLGYINTIAYNTAIDYKRKQRELPLFDNVAAQEEDRDLKIDMDFALSSLTDEEREIVLYHVHAKLSCRKIGEMMNLSKKAVYLKYQKAIAKLKEILR